ncbi:hypothetical protein ACOMHN_055143 [Nucella lapillus]
MLGAESTALGARSGTLGARSGALGGARSGPLYARSPYYGGRLGRGAAAGEMQQYQCRRCGKCYQQNCSLIRHRRSCEGRCHLNCPMCGMQFYRRDLLRRHTILVHNVTMPYVL